MHIIFVFLVICAAIVYIVGDTSDPVYDAEAKASAGISLGWIALIILALFILWIL